MAPKTNYVQLWRHQITPNNSRSIPNHLFEYIFRDIILWTSNTSKRFQQTRVEHENEDPSKKFLRNSDMGSISARKYEMEYFDLLKLWNSQNLNLRNFETLELRNFGTLELWNLETLSLFIFNWGNPFHPSTYRLPSLHQPPSCGTRGNLGGTSGRALFNLWDTSGRVGTCPTVCSKNKLSS